MLSRSVTYALRLLIRLAAAAPGQWVMGRDLAAVTGVPTNYLSKILLTLRNQGLVVAARGQGGGYRLNRAADRIKLVDVVDMYGSEADRDSCILDLNRPCSPESPCAAHEAFVGLRAKFGEVLEGTTLADLARGPRSELSPPPDRDGIEAPAAEEEEPEKAGGVKDESGKSAEELEAERNRTDED